MTGICRLRTVAQPLLSRLGFAQRRFMGASAALQYDEDEYYEEEDGDCGRSMAESDGLIPGRGVQWVFIGNPGARKHLYAEKLSKILQVPHISMGSLVRQELNPRSYLYKQIANAIDEGELVPEEIIFGLLAKRLEDGYYRGETGFILDGIPRTRIQADILDQIADIDLVVNFKCTDECLMKKHRGSNICSHCQEYIGMAKSGSYIPNLNLEQSQLKSSNAEDARDEKLRIYAEQRKAMEDYYRKRNKLIDFQVGSGPGETWQGLLAALHLQHVNAIHSSQKLTA